MRVSAYAKVNLTLDVLGKRPDGYHALRSVVQPISLADELEIDVTDDGTIASDTGYGEKDLIVRAARALRPAACPLGCRVRVTKRIPAGGGLGGGSADAAATLLALNELWSLGLSPEALAELGARVGSDVPALVLGQHYRRPVLMEGRGEIVSLLPAETSRWLVLANPGVSSSTAEVYAHCTPSGGPGAAEGSRLPNTLQEPAVRLYPAIGKALEELRACGAAGVMMSGSGATVFGFAPDGASAEKIASEVAARGYLSWTVRTLA